MTAISWLVVGGPVEPWARLGLVTQPDPEPPGARVALFATGIAVSGEGEQGMRAWIVEDPVVAVESVDGVATVTEAAGAPLFAMHSLGVQSIDHVVVATDDLERTSAAITAAFGAPLRRVREAGNVRQGFHRVGSLIVEVVERAGLEAGPASLWGFVLVVADLDAACASLGTDLIGEPRDAVQSARRIATFRQSAGLGVPVALMTPHLPGS